MFLEFTLRINHTSRHVAIARDMIYIRIRTYIVGDAFLCISQHSFSTSR